MLLTDTLGERIVGRDTAETLGSVDGVVIDAAQKTIAALRSGKGRKTKVIPWSAVTGIGDAAVVIEATDAMREPNDGAEEQQARGDVAVLGGRLLSDLGNEHGTVVDIEYDTGTGAIASIRTSQSSEIAAERIRSIGSYAWVIAASDDEA
jgi:uncharacterized protein YrrD